MPNINAALGLAQMEQIEKFINNKRNLARLYIKYFTDRGMLIVKDPPMAKSNYWLNTIGLANRPERDKFLEFTSIRGVITRPLWRLMTKLPMFSGSNYNDLSN